MKRVVQFLDMFDEIPDNAKYLYSIKVEAPSEESEEQKTARIVSNDYPKVSTNVSTNVSTIAYIHYYEVDNMDFEEIMEAGFAKKTATDKIKEFIQRYKIQMKQ